jgi:hypothetical protein
MDNYSERFLVVLMLARGTAFSWMGTSAVSGTVGSGERSTVQKNELLAAT